MEGVQANYIYFSTLAAATLIILFLEMLKFFTQFYFLIFFANERKRNILNYQCNIPSSFFPNGSSK
jgi:hypothetical protein